MRIPARGSLITAVTLLALSTPLVKWLIDRGGEAGLTQPAAIPSATSSSSETSARAW